MNYYGAKIQTTNSQSVTLFGLYVTSFTHLCIHCTVVLKNTAGHPVI